MLAPRLVPPPGPSPRTPLRSVYLAGGRWASTGLGTIKAQTTTVCTPRPNQAIG